MAVKLGTAKRKNGDELHLKTSMSQVVGLSTALAGKQDNLTQAQLDAANSGATAALIGKIGTNESAIGGIQEVIPAQATSENQLVDRNMMNSTVQTMSARPLAADASGAPFATKAALDNATSFYYGEEVVTPDEHDFATVLADEEHGNAQTRYSFANGGWAFQYLINDQPFAAAQNAAINSGITAEKVAEYDEMAAGNGNLLSKDEAALTYAKKDYVEGLGTVYIVEPGADLSGFNDNDLIIELEAE